MDTEVRVLNNRHEAVAALQQLERDGVPKSAITVMSSEPLHLECEGPKTRIPLFGIIGGLLGAAFAILLTVWTSKRVGLVTGGMPIVSPWAFGIIVFELAALGAILMTLGRMVVEARLARRGRGSDYGKMVAEGKIVIEIDPGATKG
ncbi:MAG TPA: quinol:electron acceptor oxidoreductase subunit ActD [Blastocatellia bacterium]|nr:quinol:electron acceptor oxidoreductase subunit ActD [Blastocatellia bacterium]